MVIQCLQVGWCFSSSPDARVRTSGLVTCLPAAAKCNATKPRPWRPVMLDGPTNMSRVSQEGEVDTEWGRNIRSSGELYQQPKLYIRSIYVAILDESRGVGKPWKTYLMDILWPPTSPQVIFEGGGSPPHVGTVLHMTGLQEFQPSDAKGLRAGVVLPSGEVLALRIGDGPTLGWGAQQHGNVALQWLTMPVDLASMGNKINKCL